MKSQFRAINRFISKVKSTSSIDGISSSGTFQIEDISVAGFSLPQGASTYFVTADFAQTGKEEIFRIVNTTGDVLTYDKRIPVGGYIKPAHTAGASIRVNDVADILNEMSDNIDNFGDINQIDGTQTIKVWGGVFNNGGTVYNVANQTLIVTVGQLVDNTTNYVHFDITTRLFIVTASSTLAAAVCIGSVVVTGGTIGTITDLRPSLAMTYGEITTKLDKSGGLRDTMQSNKTTDAVFIAGKTKVPLVNADFATGSGTQSSGGWIGAATYGWYLNNGLGTYTASYDTGRMKLQTSAVSSYMEVGVSVGYYPLDQYAIPVEPNTAYSIDYDMETLLSSGTSNDGAFLIACTYDSVGGSVVEYAGTKVKITSGSTHYTLNFTTGANTRYINPQMRIYGHTGTGTLQMSAWFDNIVVTCSSKEIMKTITPSASILPTDKLLLEKQDGSLAKTKVSDFSSGIGLSITASAVESGIVSGDPVGLIQDSLYKIQAENATSNSSSTPTEVLQTEKMSATTYAVCYQTGGTLYAIICTVAGDVVTFGSAQTIGSAGSAVNGGMARIGTNKLAFAYMDTAAAFPSHPVFAAVGTVSGTTISMSGAVTVVTLSTGGTWNCYLQGFCRIRDDAFAFNAYDQTGAGAAYGCTVSGTTPSVASTLIGTGSNIPMVWLADNRIALTWSTAMRMLEINPASLVVTTTYTGTVGNTFNTIARLSDTSFVAGGYSSIADANIYFFEKPGAGTTLTQNSIGTLGAINQQLIPIYDGVFGVHTGGSIIVMDGKQVLWTIAGVSAMPSIKTFPVYMNGRLFYHSLTSLQSRIVRLARAFYIGIAIDSIGGFKPRFSFVTKTGVVFPYVYYLQTNGTVDRVMYTTGATRVGKAIGSNLLLLE